MIRQMEDEVRIGAKHKVYLGALRYLGGLWDGGDALELDGYLRALQGLPIRIPR